MALPLDASSSPPAEQEVRDGADEVHEGRHRPQSLAAPDLLLRTPPYVHESRDQQRNLDRPREHDTSLLSGAEFAPPFVRHHHTPFERFWFLLLGESTARAPSRPEQHEPSR